MKGTSNEELIRIVRKGREIARDMFPKFQVNNVDGSGRTNWHEA